MNQLVDGFVESPRRPIFDIPVDRVDDSLAHLEHPDRLYHYGHSGGSPSESSSSESISRNSGLSSSTSESSSEYESQSFDESGLHGEQAVDVINEERHNTSSPHNVGGFEQHLGPDSPRRPPRHLQFDVDLAREATASEFATNPRGTSHHRREGSDQTQSTATRKKYGKRFSTQPHPPSPKRGWHTSSAGTDGGSPTDCNSNEKDGNVGQEPGVNVETMYVDLPDSKGSQITLIDYSPEDCSIKHYDVEKDGGCIITGSSERYMLRHHISDALDSRPSWSKVRWVVVNGLSWEAIQPISMKYGLHPLAVEDMMDVPQRTKMEVFPGQIFCCFPLHVLSTTPTPYSIMSVCMRHVVMFFVAFLRSMKKVYLMAKRLCARVSASSRAVKQKNGSPDIESGNKTGKPAMVEPWSNSPESSFYKSSMKNKTFTSSRSHAFDWNTVNSFTSESSFSNSESTLCEESTYPESIKECIPFYTLNRGVLCGDAESSPVAAAIRNMPSRSIYEWNQGNMALQREALQNMHIPGSLNSIEIALEQVSLFLVGDTVITFFEKSAPRIYRPLEHRLMSADTMLRSSSDPAILVQALLDASVDLIGPILNEYRSRLNRLQVSSIQQPNLQHTRALHAFITDLTVLRPPLSSLVSIVEHLWSKSVATREKSLKSRSASQGHKEKSKHVLLGSHSDYDLGGSDDEKSSDGGYLYRRCGHARRNSVKNAVRNRISEAAALYFRDVADHALRYLQDLDDMRSQSRTLSSLIFNTISIKASDSVKLLSLVSVIFLPLTFLTGYFGMNFKDFSVLDHDVGYYWVVATPAAVALTIFVMYPSMVTMTQEVCTWVREQV